MCDSLQHVYKTDHMPFGSPQNTEKKSVLEHVRLFPINTHTHTHTHTIINHFKYDLVS